MDAFKAQQNNANLFLVDLGASIASCSHEIFDMLHKCLGHCERTNKFMKTHRNSLNYQSTFSDSSKPSENGFMLSLANKFGDLGGFQILLDFIQITPAFKCPITLVGNTIKTLSKLHEIGLKPQFVQETNV